MISLKAVLSLGVPLAVVSVVATALGPIRVQNLGCRLRACPLTVPLEQLCDLRARSLHVAPAEREAWVAERFSKGWPTPQGLRLLAEVRDARPGERWDVLRAALVAEGRPEWRCAALEAHHLAPVALTGAHLVVDGEPLMRLDEGRRVPDAAVDASGLGVPRLVEALSERRGDGPLTVGLHPGAPSWSALQVVHSAGLAGYAQVSLQLLDAGPASVRVDLPEVGPCDDCLASVESVGWASSDPRVPVVAVLGRRAPRAPASADWGLAAIPADEGLRIATRLPAEVQDGPASALRGIPRAVVVPAPDVSARALVRALMELRGPEADRPRVGTVALGAAKSVLDGAHRLSFRGAKVRIGTGAALRPPAWSRAPSPSTAPTHEARDVVPASKDTDQERIVRALRPRVRGLRACYERALRLSQDLGGKVVVRFELLENGRPTAIQVEDLSLNSRRVTSCIRRLARRWRLPAPFGGPVLVEYPLVFERAPS